MPEIPLCNFLAQFSNLDLDDFETEEDWYDALLYQFQTFLYQLQTILGTTQKESQKYASSFICYVAQKHLELFAIIFTFYIFMHSPSQQDVQEIGEKVDEGQKQNEEQNRRLEEKVDRMTELLEKSLNSHTEDELSSSEVQVLCRTISDIEVQSEPNAAASSIAALAIDEPIKIVETQENEWIKIEFFDYIHWEIKTGWIQINDIEPLVSKTEPEVNPIDEVATPSSQQLAETSRRLHDRYAKTFQRLAKE